jgi:hypothetical protein
MASMNGRGRRAIRGREDQRSPDQPHDLAEQPRFQLKVPKLEVLREVEKGV